VGLSILAPGDGRREYGIEEEFVSVINAVLIAVMIYYLSLKVCLHFVFQREHSVYLPEGPVGSCCTGKQSLFIGAFAKLRKMAISFVMSVCLFIRLFACNNSAPTGRIFVKFCLLIFENL
jgi:hypothetical protein